MVKNYDSFHFNIRVCIGADNRNLLKSETECRTFLQVYTELILVVRVIIL